MRSRVRNLVAGLVAMTMVTGCGMGEPSQQERVAEVSAKLGLDRAGSLLVLKNQVNLVHVRDGAPVEVRQSKSREPEQTPPADPGSLALKMVPISTLTGHDLWSRISAQKEACGDAAPGARVLATVGGGVIQDVICASGERPVKKSYLDGQEVEPVDSWDQATLDRVLAEARLVQGPRARSLHFFTPQSRAIDPAFRASFVSGKVASDTSPACSVASHRAAGYRASIGMWHYQGCSDGATLGDGETMLDQLSGAKILAALTRAQDRMGVGPDAVGSFEIFTTGGRIKVQVNAGRDAPTAVPGLQVDL